MLCSLSPQGLCDDDLSPALFFLCNQGCPLPPSCLLKRVGSDHLDVWALPRGQGGSEGDRLLPAPTLSPGLLCCFRAKASQSLPVLFCVLPPPPPLLPPPHCLPKELKCQLRIWGQSVSPACPCFALVSLQPQADQCPHVNPLASLHGLILSSPTS